MEEGEISDKSTKVVESELIWEMGLERKKDREVPDIYYNSSTFKTLVYSILKKIFPFY